MIPVVSLIAAFAGSVMSVRPARAEASPLGWNKLATANFDPATWKSTLEEPLPTMQSPITFKLGDEPSYWYDNGRPDVEGVLHTRSLVASAGPTTVRFSVGEPFTSVQHTFSSLIWPEGAENMPFRQTGGETGDHEVNLTTPGLYAFYCAIHPYMLGAVLIDDPTTPGADFGAKLHWLDGTTIPSSADEVTPSDSATPSNRASGWPET